MPGFVLERPLLLVTTARNSSRLLERFAEFTQHFAHTRRPAATNGS